jgi:hypothetical protein
MFHLKEQKAKLNHVNGHPPDPKTAAELFDK